jgi:hypothetical protein
MKKEQIKVIIETDKSIFKESDLNGIIIILKIDKPLSLDI